MNDRDDSICLGSFDVTGDALVVTDPCYDCSVWCKGILENVVPGKWVGFLEREHGRVSALEAFVKGRSCRTDDDDWHRATFEVGVDSGQAGIFDEERYPQEKCGEYNERGSFYNRACEATAGINPCDDRDKNGPDFLKEHPGGDVMAEGVVSSSGYGDGSYVCRYRVDHLGKIDGVRIDFMSDADDEENEEEE